MEEIIVSNNVEKKNYLRIMKKYMFIKNEGVAIHLLGDVSRNCLDCELIYVYNEDGEYWIGQYCEGFGLFNVKFLKSDCRDATQDEVKLCEKGKAKEIRYER